MFPDFTAADYTHMARALRLAEHGLYSTQPNPRVGCVLARDGLVVGEGWHDRAGEAHAEVVALRAAGERARGATAYVTLEPCAHFGRTPPCADALIAAGVARIVAACEDPNPSVSGRGMHRMQAAGIACDMGLLRNEARALNRGFMSRMERQRPWVRIKLAMSLDGRTALANGASQWITGEAARADVQHWRARSSAIMTGSGTVLADNPRLTVRADQLAHERASMESTYFVAPLRVVLDRALMTPRGANLLDGSVPTLILHGEDSAAVDDRFARVECGAVPLDRSSGGLDLPAVLAMLAQRGDNELQVEAGPRLCGALFTAGLVDELLLYVAPVLLGDSARPLLALPALQTIAEGRRLRVVDQRQIGDDLRLRCEVQPN